MCIIIVISQTWKPRLKDAKTPAGFELRFPMTSPAKGPEGNSGCWGRQRAEPADDALFTTAPCYHPRQSRWQGPSLSLWQGPLLSDSTCEHFPDAAATFTRNRVLIFPKPSLINTPVLTRVRQQEHRPRSGHVSACENMGLAGARCDKTHLGSGF